MGRAVMEQKSSSQWWHHVVALLLGYVAAGITYEIIPLVLAYPVGMLSVATRSSFFSLCVLRGVGTLAAIVVWVIVYRRCEIGGSGHDGPPVRSSRGGNENDMLWSCPAV